MQGLNRAAKLLYDVKEACTKLGRFCAGKTLKDYENDDLLRSAVERQFTIIGEALAQLRSDAPDTAEKIPALRDIVGFRNRLVHGYSAVQDRAVWEIVERDLLPLAEETEKLLKEF